MHYIDHRETGALRAQIKPVLYLDDDSEMELPTRWEVCPTCDGRGTHVNPAIDAGGIDADMFAEDPDFADDYLAGRYDVRCMECQGRTTVRVVNEDELTPDQLRQWHEQERSVYDMYAEMAAERRMGA